jgi:hypothetical protein
MRSYLIRLVVTLLISLVAMIALSEGTYLLMREEYDRGPQTFQIIVPQGTAEKVAQGEQVPTVPEDHIFVTGDTLEVVNQDMVDHQLGPIWVPAGAKGSLVLEDAEKFSYSCSFSPSNYLGFDVRQATTWQTRLTGLGISVPTTTAFLFIYSLVAFPMDGRKKPASQEQAA